MFQSKCTHFNDKNFAHKTISFLTAYFMAAGGIVCSVNILTVSTWNKNQICVSYSSFLSCFYVDFWLEYCFVSMPLIFLWNGIIQHFHFSNLFEDEIKHISTRKCNQELLLLFKQKRFMKLLKQMIYWCGGNHIEIAWAMWNKETYWLLQSCDLECMGRTMVLCACH